jgi:hypothetical protein
MIPDACACSLPPHTTWPYLTNRTYRQNAGTLGGWTGCHLKTPSGPRIRRA